MKDIIIDFTKDQADQTISISSTTELNCKMLFQGKTATEIQWNTPGILPKLDKVPNDPMKYVPGTTNNATFKIVIPKEIQIQHFICEFQGKKRELYLYR
jgi:hypothetical protein